MPFIIKKYPAYDELICKEDFIILNKTTTSNHIYQKGQTKKDFEHLHSSKHFHNTFEMMYVKKGKIEHKIENQSFTYYENELCLLSPHIIHQEIISEDSEILFINFSKHFIQNLLPYIRSMKCYPFFKTILDQFDQKRYLYYRPTLDYLKSLTFHSLNDKIEPLIIHLLQNQMASSLFIDAYFISLLEALNQPHYYFEDHPYLLTHEQRIVTQVKSYIKETKGCINRQQLSELLHYHPDYLNHIIKKETEFSLHQLIKEMQFQMICKDLIDSNESCLKILEKYQYRYPSHFYSFFKSKMHMSVNAYRKIHKKIP